VLRVISIIWERGQPSGSLVRTITPNDSITDGRQMTTQPNIDGLSKNKMLWHRGPVSEFFPGSEKGVSQKRAETQALPVLHMGHQLIQTPIHDPRPRVATPADNLSMVFTSPIFPPGFKSLPLADGYHEAHQRYIAHKQHLQKLASAMGVKPEVTSVNFHMKTFHKKIIPVAVSD
jgi:hypothetical protein